MQVASSLLGACVQVNGGDGGIPRLDLLLAVDLHPVALPLPAALVHLSQRNRTVAPSEVHQSQCLVLLPLIDHRPHHLTPPHQLINQFGIKDEECSLVVLLQRLHALCIQVMSTRG